jgi:hypothetical protein
MHCAPTILRRPMGAVKVPDGCEDYNTATEMTSTYKTNEKTACGIRQ